MEKERVRVKNALACTAISYQNIWFAVTCGTQCFQGVNIDDKQLQSVKVCISV